MSSFVTQRLESVLRGKWIVCATVVNLSSSSASIELPNMASTSNSVVQLRRPGDLAVTVTQADINTVNITNGEAGKDVLLVSLHSDPVPTPR